MRQDRRSADGLVLRLPVLIVRGAANPAPDPIVHLIGGPGGSMASYGDTLGTSFGLALSAAAGRDVIFFDQRGTGGSEPRLDCTAGEAIPACVARLARDGIRVESFNSEENAADVEDLRRSLGLERVNLYGQSYGTLLAQTVARRHPAGVRSLMLESTTAVAHDALLTNSPRSFELVVRRVVEECGADAACRQSFPQFAEGVAAIVTRLPAGSDASVRILGAMNLLLQFSQGTSYIPLFVKAVVDTDNATLMRVIALVEATSQLQARAAVGFSELMRLAMDCYDYAPLRTSAREQEVNGATPASLRAAFSSGLEGASACAMLPPSYVSAAQLQPVTSALPTLLLAGGHDTNTPLEIAQLVQRDLGQSYLVTRPGWGHLMLILGDRCGLQAYADFVADPSRPPTTACLASARTTFATSIP